MKRRMCIFFAAFGVIICACALITGRNTADASPKTYKAGDVVYYGSYPQTMVTNQTLIAKLEEETQDASWKAYRYCSASTSDGSAFPMKRNEQMMSYCDFTYGASKYRAVRINETRPLAVTGTTNDSSAPQYASGFRSNKTYFFRWEPLEWIVLDPSNGLLLCKKGIDAQPFNEWFKVNNSGTKINAVDSSKAVNDYYYSTIRKFLRGDSSGGDYYSMGLTPWSFPSVYSQSPIVKTEIQNLDGSKKSEDTFFLLSQSEFNSFKNVTGVSSYTATDYAMAQGCGTRTNPRYFLRTKPTSGYSSDTAIAATGTTSANTQLDYTRIENCKAAVRPAVKVTLSSEMIKDPLSTTPTLALRDDAYDKKECKPTFRFDKPSGAERLEMYRREASLGYNSDLDGWELIATINAAFSMFTDNEAHVGKTYYYAARAYGENWRVDSSNYVTRDSRPEAVDVSWHFDSSGKKWVITWQEKENVFSYRLLRQNANNEWVQFGCFDSGNTPRYDWAYDITLKPGDHYRLRLCVAPDQSNSRYDSDPSALLEFDYSAVFFDLNGGTSGAPATVGLLPGETDVTIPKSSPKRSGYYFLGWSTSPTATMPQYKSNDSIGIGNVNITLYAVWKIRNYALTYVLNGGTNNPANPSSYTIASPALFLKDASRVGYRFDGWYTDAALTKKSSGVAPGSIGDRTFYAKFTKMPDVTIRFSRNGGTGNAPSPITVKYREVWTVPNVFPTREGYYYLGWSVDKNATEAQFKAGNKIYSMEDTTFHAVWKPRTNTITFNSNGGSGTLPPTIKVLTGKKATVGKSTMSRNGYWFLGWSADKNATTATYKTGSEIGVTKDTVLYAVWKKK